MEKAINLEEGIYKYLKIESLNLGIDDFYYGDKGEKSLYFKGKEGVKPVDFLRDLFGITKDSSFDEKFLESITGDGNEGKKNYALKSSSLCALLFFYKVSEQNPIFYDGIKYTKVYLEVKNKAVASSRPSNIDVVLIGKKVEEDDSILFIESKFSEYMDGGKYALGKSYLKEPYRHMFFNDVFCYENYKICQYGLKQLVTHYIGIRNFLRSNKEQYKKMMAKSYGGKIGDRIKVYKEYEHVGFLEIVFGMPEERFCKYMSGAKTVFESLKIEKKNDHLGKLKLYGTTTYQNFFTGERKEILDDKVKEYYKID